jgi:hypothetical protein
MNVCIRNTFVSLWLVFATVSLSAQGAKFYFPTIENAAQGSVKILPLRAVNLDSVVSMQFVIRWDPKELQFFSLNNINFSDLSLADFNSANSLDSGYIRMQWEGPSSIPPGASVADSTEILRLRLKVIGANGVCTPVKITEILNFPPLNFELIKVLPDTSNSSYDLDDCPRKDGLVCIGITSATEEPGANEIPLTLSPNPFSVSAQLNFILDETADTQVFITDALGRIVFEKNFFKLQPGQHGMVIENSIITAPGVYSLTVQAGRKIATRSFVTF